MTSTTPLHPSSFLDPTISATSSSLAILYLKRDLLLPVILQAHDPLHEGYSEGKVTNTRFGSYPHSTLIGKPWGAQVRASAVDTGSRGKNKKGKKRKRGNGDGTGNGEEEGPTGEVAADKPGSDDGGEAMLVDVDEREERPPKAAVVASTGFAHLLPPTPEIWTASLPHRTQVVYTPDYSYILQRLRVRPGTVLIEAGAGSGSFTHAAARAVFNGYPERGGDLGMEDGSGSRPKKKYGQVWSYEFHEQRMRKLKEEITEHGLDGIVTITHKDVCQDGFGLDPSITSAVGANAVFLDLPAPWLALKHLTRASIVQPVPQNSPTHSEGDTLEHFKDTATHAAEDSHHASRFHPLLNPTSSIHLCTFSPCIEQVQRTITTMRQLGWLDIDMVEIAAKRIEVRRERVGLQEEGLRGVNASPATVDEAVARLREVESRSRTFHHDVSAGAVKPAGNSTSTVSDMSSKQQRIEKNKEVQDTRKLYKEGRLVHRSEPDLKTHTSYLVFAILPREWTAADELKAQQRWPSNVTTLEEKSQHMSRREEKKRAAGGQKKV